LPLEVHVQIKQLTPLVFHAVCHNFFRDPRISGSNPVASSDGGESCFRAKTAGAVRATEFVSMFLMNKEFGH
jgi:hypothetical protein